MFTGLCWFSRLLFFFFFYSIWQRDSGRIELLLIFCSGTCNLVLCGWLRLGLLDSLRLGTEISISENFLILFKKWSGFPEELMKEADLISRYNLTSTYLVGAWIIHFFPLFEFPFFLEHICYSAEFFGSLSSPSSKEYLSVYPYPMSSEWCCSLQCLLL